MAHIETDPMTGGPAPYDPDGANDQPLTRDEAVHELRFDVAEAARRQGLTESSILDKHPLAGYTSPRGECPWGEPSDEELEAWGIEPIAWRAWKAMNPAIRGTRRRETLSQLRDKLARIDAIINNAAPAPNGEIPAIQAIIDEEPKS